MRIWVHELLVNRCGWSEADARKLAANVSHFYDNRIRSSKTPKDGGGVAIYDESDIDGLMEAAHNIRGGIASENAYEKPTRFIGTTEKEMGY